LEEWRAKLVAGDTDGAWDLFIHQYRRLILAAIRRTLRSDEDVEEVFAEVCADLCADGLARLRSHSDSVTARYSTWLVAVVHHRTIDWIRRRDGRTRVSPPASLNCLQTEIFKALVLERRSHAEAYEVVQQRSKITLSFRDFMNEVAATYREMQHAPGRGIGTFFPGPPPEITPEAPDPHATLLLSENSERLRAALAKLPSDESLAVQLFVIEELPAAAVAKIVGWPNPKAVYNRVSRAMAKLQLDLRNMGVTPGED
jgi:RNA polymerase sigma factor (sigma-70 family)